MKSFSLHRLTLLISIAFFLANTIRSADTLRVGCTSAPPFIIDESNLVGINIWLWEKVCDDLNISYELVEMPFQQMLTSLEKHHIDVSINPLTMTSERSEKMNFTSPFYVSSDAVAMRKRGRLSDARAVLRTFFSTEFLGALLLLVFIIGIFGSLVWYFERKNNQTHFRKGIHGIWDGLWWSAVTMTTVGYGDKSPKSTGGKVVALIWMFTAIMFISGLTASIASTILTIKDSGNTVSLDNLKEMNVGTLDGTSTEAYLRSRFFRNINTYDAIHDGLEALGTKKIEAFIYDEAILKYRLNELSESSCTVLPLKFNMQLYAFGLSTAHHDLIHKISERILYYTNSIEWNVLLQEYDLETL